VSASAVKKVETSLFSATVQACSVHSKQDWLAKLAAAPPSDSFVTCASFCLHLPALACTNDLRAPLPARTRPMFFVLSLPDPPPPSVSTSLVARPLPGHVLCACPLRMSFAHVLCACPLHTPQPFRFSFDTLATTVIFLAATVEIPDPSVTPRRSTSLVGLLVPANLSL
jgi:hypothetical protein